MLAGEGSLTLLRTGGHSFLVDLLAADPGLAQALAEPQPATARIAPAAMPKNAPLQAPPKSS